MNNKINYLNFANRLGIFLVVLFVICFAWYYIRSVEQGLHLQLFRLFYFGFSEMNFSAFILGAIQTYLWAYILMGTWKLIDFIFNK